MKGPDVVRKASSSLARACLDQDKVVGSIPTELQIFLHQDARMSRIVGVMQQAFSQSLEYTLLCVVRMVDGLPSKCGEISQL